MDEYELSEMAERHMDSFDPAPTKVFCGHCGSTMAVEKLGRDSFQCVCSMCGTSGPRADNKEEALTLAFELFPD
jgi:hypothetical protein